MIPTMEIINILSGSIVTETPTLAEETADLFSYIQTETNRIFLSIVQNGRFDVENDIEADVIRTKIDEGITNVSRLINISVSELPGPIPIYRDFINDVRNKRTI